MAETPVVVTLDTDAVVAKVKAYIDDHVRQGLVVLGVLSETVEEMARQDTIWGAQDYPDGTGRPHDREMANLARRACKLAAANGTVTWRHVLYEEAWEALAEDDPAKLRAELVQVEAVCAQWRMAIDRRSA